VRERGRRIRKKIPKKQIKVKGKYQIRLYALKPGKDLDNVWENRFSDLPKVSALGGNEVVVRERTFSPLPENYDTSLR
jgi:hypothetical protein